MTHLLVKRNRRFHVIFGSETIFTLPDFMRPWIRSREDFKELLADLDAGRRRIDALIDFEHRLNPLRR